MVDIKIHKLREQLLNRGIKAFAVLGFLLLLASLSRISYAGWHPLMFLQVGLYLIILLLLLGGKYISYSLRADILSGVVFILGLGVLIGGGFAVFGLLALGCFCILSTIFKGTKAGIASSILNIVVIGSIGICVHMGIIQYKYSPILDLNRSSIWIGGIIALAMLMGIAVVILGTLNQQIEGFAHTLQKQNEEITEKNRLLERDITERIRMEKERRTLEGKLQLAQKMETVGKLAGGVAHDLNNTLGSIIGYPELMLMDLPKNSQLREPLETIKKTGLKAAAIVNDMLTLARSGVTDTKVFDLNAVIDDYLKSSEFDQLKFFHPKAQVEIKLENAPLHIRGSFYHLSKVAMNLVSNAAEAMPNGGTIIVSTKKQSIEKKIPDNSGFARGEYALLSVSDTGVGIPKGELEKIFEPFYTKKTMGRSGTGLGMTVVWNSVKDHNGYIDVESIEGEGTKFIVYIPLTGEEATVEPVPSFNEDFLGRGELILVVDDVAEQRRIAVEILRQMGYRVHAVGSGEEAVDYLSRTHVDLLVLDMIMDPGMDGLETYKRILKNHPNQKAIITSGFSQTLKVREALSLGAGAYLKKPFLCNQIGHAVRRELDKNTDNRNLGRWN